MKDLEMVKAYYIYIFARLIYKNKQRSFVNIIEFVLF